MAVETTTPTIEGLTNPTSGAESVGDTSSFNWSGVISSALNAAGNIWGKQPTQITPQYANQASNNNNTIYVIAGVVIIAIVAVFALKNK